MDHKELNGQGKAQPTDPAEIIDSIYEGWQYIGRDENGNDYRLPLKKRVITRSRQLLEMLKATGSTDSYVTAHQAYISKVLKNAMKRKMIVSWKFIIIVLAFLGFWVWQTKVYKPAGYWVTDLTIEELSTKQQADITRLSKNVYEYINIEIPETEARIEELKKAPDSEENREELKKSKERLKSLHELLADDQRELNGIKDVTPEGYREFTIAESKKENISIIGGLVIWAIALILYFISQRRPYFMFWRKSYNNGNLVDLDSAGGALVGAAMMDSLVNFDSNSTEYYRWSDGTVTSETDLTKGGMNIILAVVLLLFYIMIMVISLPLRVVIGFLRNYILYI